MHPTPACAPSDTGSSAPQQSIPSLDAARVAELNALSPLDGRYAAKVEPLAHWLSESALMRERVYVEVEWLIALAEVGSADFPRIDAAARQRLRALAAGFGELEAARIKAIEATTNHDVKAVEYFLKEKFEAGKLSKYKELIHFSCTSEDINNLAYALMIQNACSQVMHK